MLDVRRDLNRLLDELLGPPLPPPMARRLGQHTARLCRLNHDGFPGAQPVSFVKSDIAGLQKKDYWVCEKSDGIRVLMVVISQNNAQEVFLLDRNNTYRSVNGFYFPHYEDPARALGNSVLDGELLVDVDPLTRKETTRLLLFDCLVCDDQNLMSKPLISRYGRLQDWLLIPFKRMLKEMPHLAKNMSFELGIKKMELSYGLPLVLNEYIPRLHHGSDGLIFTCVKTGYVSGADSTLSLKWKPPSENSIDFKLELRFPPHQSGSQEADSCAVPLCLLMVWYGKSVYEYFDVLELDEAEWADMKASNSQYDDRIVEVHWDFERQRWKFMRFRNDKRNGNHRSTVDGIINSILDGVREDELIAAAPTIREAWKARERDPPDVPARNAQQGHSVNPVLPSQPHRHSPPPPPEIGRGTIRAGRPYHVANRFSKVGGPKQILDWKR